MNFQRPKFKIYSGEPVRIIQRKMDGHYAQIEVGDQIVVKTRTPGIDLWPKLFGSPAFEPLARVPKGTIIVGELHKTGAHATDVKTFINDGTIEFAPFALPWWYHHNMIDMNFATAMNLLGDLGFCVPEYSFGPTAVCHDPEELKKAAKDLGYEGFVCKEAHCEGWYKCKPTKTIDAFVTGFTRSSSFSNFGSLRGIQCSVKTVSGGNLEIANVGSGFDADFRDRVDPRTLLGRVCELEFDSFAGKGRLKFPRFLRWRDDKSPEECVL